MSAPETPHPAQTAHTQNALAQARVTRLATMLPVHRAFHWLHLHQPQLRRWQLEMLAIPAPPFLEAERAAWFLDRFRALGLANVHLDDEGNALGEHTSSEHSEERPFLLVSAHLDTVFPAETETRPAEDAESARILSPGACDNAAGLTALLALIAALRFASITPPTSILFAANVGEEGEGDLRGMRQIFERGPYKGRIAAALALEGSGTSTAVIRALGSRRLRVTISGPGGHSWTDAGRPNPIVLLSRGIVILADAPTAQQDNTRTTFSPGQILGGTSVNSIPESASVLLDLRSTDPEQLDLHQALIKKTFTELVRHANQVLTSSPATLKIEVIGDRPAATLSPRSPLLDTLRAVDRHLGLRTEFRLGSTDANLPLSLGIPAMALAAGGTGGGIHTLAEWYDPAGRVTALRRVLLILLDLAQTL